MTFALFGMVCVGILLLWFSLVHPAAFLAIYLLAYTSFFGFVDFTWIEIRGFLNVFILLNMVVLVSIAMALAKGVVVRASVVWIAAMVLLLFAFGVSYPILKGESGLVSAVTDGKDFLCFSLLPYLALNRSRLDDRTIQGMVVVFSLILVAILAAVSLLGLAPPAYRPVDPFLGVRAGIHSESPMLILLGFSFLIVDGPDRRLWRWLLAGAILAGLAVQGYRSVMLAALVVLGFSLMDGIRSRLNPWLNGAVLLFGLATVVFLVFTGLAQKAGIPAGIEQDSAIRSRLAYNEMRFAAISESPLIGHGFIDETSDAGEKYFLWGRNRFEQTLGTIDAGYVDLIVRFGGIGTLLLLFAWLRSSLDGMDDKRSIAVRTFLLSYLVIGFTWSVFTYRHGIVPACIAMACLQPNNRSDE